MTDNSFKEWLSMTDNALTGQIGAFVRHHRMEQNKTQGELAKAAGISRSTLSLLERGETVTVNTLIQVLRVLDQLNFMNFFEIRETLSPLALAKMQKKKTKTGKRQKFLNQILTFNSNNVFHETQSPFLTVSRYPDTLHHRLPVRYTTAVFS